MMRKLGFWDVFCLAAGAMISSGLFVLPAIAFTQAGPGVVLAYTLAGLMMIPAMFSQAELATAMPRSGGSYFFIERSMGALPGLLAGLANWLSIALKSAFALIGIGAFARLIWPELTDTGIQWIAVGACVFFMALNLLSVKGTGRFQMFMVAVLLGLLAAFVVTGFPSVQHASFKGFLDKGMEKVLATAGLVFISYGGLTKVASVAGEVRNPGRSLPAGMFAASILVSFLYVAAVFVVVGITPAELLKGNNLTPLSTAAEYGMMGRVGAILLAVAGVLAFFTTANGGILSASRVPMAMSRDGLLPAVFQKVSHRFHTPQISILLTGAFMIAIIALLGIENLVKVASTMMLMLFLLVNVAVLIMRGSRIQNYRPLFRTPFFPAFQIAGILLYAFLIMEMGKAALLTTGVFALVGAAWYLVYVRSRSNRESAFVYMVKNIVSKDFRRAHLEEELRDIAFERDEVTHDRFDELIKRCVILDLPESCPAEEMFRMAAETLSPRLKINADILLEKFRAREADSSTVIEPGLAIPHIIIDGEKLFDILLVRCKSGIIFPGHDEPVRTAFILIGSRDERNYHLKALMAIAHIVQEHQFRQRWLSAAGDEHLRDIVLLSQRTREA